MSSKSPYHAPETAEEVARFEKLMEFQEQERVTSLDGPLDAEYRRIRRDAAEHAKDMPGNLVLWSQKGRKHA